jgi:arylsulfatase A-like enzyme
MAHYYGAISHIDHMIGKMIAKLISKGLYDNTLIIYTSDHGEYMGFHHMLSKSNYMYEPLAKVPLIVKYPGNEQAGERSSRLVNNIDIAATILQAAGMEKAKIMPGADIRGTAGEPKTFVIAEDSRGRQYMVRNERYKLILTRDPTKSVFFDLETDPLELHNLIDDPLYEREIQRCRDDLFQTLLFDAPSPSYLDMQSDLIAGDHVPQDRETIASVSRWIADHYWET